MTELTRVRSISAIVPVTCSALAFALVSANIVAGVPPQSDEGTSAHIWQLLIAVQVPLIVTHCALADWSRRSSAFWLGAQLLGIVAAATPVFMMGY